MEVTFLETNTNDSTLKSWISGKHTRAGLFLQKPSKNITVDPLASVKKVGVGNMYLTNEGLIYQEELLEPTDIRSIKLIKYPGMPANISMKTLEITFIADPEILLIVDTDMSPKALKSDVIEELYDKLKLLVQSENLTRKLPGSRLRNKEKTSTLRKLRKLAGYIGLIILAVFLLNNYFNIFGS